MICIKTSIKEDRYRRNLEAVKFAVSASQVKTVGRRTANHEMSLEQKLADQIKKKMNERNGVIGAKNNNRSRTKAF
jgi:hypothetical protein